MREKLAAYAHTAWSGWMKRMFSRTSSSVDGSKTIPPLLCSRWTRQMNTDYTDLPEEEKASDRAEADDILSTIVKGSPTVLAMTQVRLIEIVRRTYTTGHVDRITADRMLDDLGVGILDSEDMLDHWGVERKSSSLSDAELMMEASRRGLTAFRTREAQDDR